MQLKKIRITPLCVAIGLFLSHSELYAQGVANYPATNAYGRVDQVPANPLFAQPSTSRISEAAYDPFLQTDESIRLAQNTSSIVTEKNSVLAPTGAPPINDRSRQLLQGIDLKNEWIPQFDEDSLGETSSSLAVKLGMPAPFIGGPLLVKPRLGIKLLDGPDVTDVPARLYDMEVGFATFRKINARWMLNASVNVGVYADDYSLDTDDALQVSGMIMGIYSQSPQVQWVFGVAALNRNDLPVLPIIGLTVDQGWVKYEATFPRPRIVWRLPDCGPDEERALYVGGDIGGGSWAVQRTSGLTDSINLSRFGFLIGYEQTTPNQTKVNYELGYLFNREIEFEETGETFDLDDSLFARINLAF